MLEEEQGNPISSYNDALLVLQTPSSSLDARVGALRFLQSYVKGGSSESRKMDDRTRRSINQLVLNNVLEIVMGEDRTCDLRTRQLLRTECFLMLSSLLGSDSLFSGIKEKLDDIETATAATVASSSLSSTSQALTNVLADMKHKQLSAQMRGRGGGGGTTAAAPYDDLASLSLTASFASSSSSSSPPSYLSPSRAGGTRRGGSPPAAAAPTLQGEYMLEIQAMLNNEDIDQAEAAAAVGRGDTAAAKGELRVSVSAPGQAKKRPMSPVRNAAAGGGGGGGLDAFDSMSTMTNAHTYNGSTGGGGGGRGGGEGELPLMRSTLTKPSLHLLKDKRLRPRPTVLFSGDLAFDEFSLSKVEKGNFLEQDVKLGYQKPRVWFPVPGIVVDRSMLPKDRSSGAHMEPDRLVQEYMQMRALLSYMGDLVVVPFKGRTITKTSAGVDALRSEKQDFLSRQVELEERGESVEQQLLREQEEEGEEEGKGSGVSRVTIKPLLRLKGVLSNQRFDRAVEEAVAVWTPLLGTHLPTWAKKQAAGSSSGSSSSSSSSQQGIGKGSIYDGSSSSSSSSSIASSSSRVGKGRLSHEDEESSLGSYSYGGGGGSERSGVERSVLFTKGVLRRLLRKELVNSQATTQTLKDTLSLLVGGSNNKGVTAGASGGGAGVVGVEKGLVKKIQGYV